LGAASGMLAGLTEKPRAISRHVPLTIG
jgi:hypothetical protein